MSCGVNIPLSDIATAIINDFGATIASEVIKYIDLDGANLKNPVLTGTLTADNTIVQGLCEYLQGCIDASVEEKLGCDNDDHVVSFSLTEDKLLLKLKHGSEFYVSKAELMEWFGSQNGVTGGSVVDTPTGKIIRLTTTNGGNIDIDVSSLGAVKTVKGVNLRNDGNKAFLDILLTDGTTLTADVSTLAVQKPVIVNARVDGNKLVLTRDDQSTVEVTLPANNAPSATPVDKNTKLVKAEIVGNRLKLTNDDESFVEVDLPQSGGQGQPTGGVNNIKDFRLAGNELILELTDGTIHRISLDGVVGTTTTPTADMCKLTLRNITSYRSYAIDDGLGKNVTLRLTEAGSRFSVSKPSDDFIGTSITIRDAFPTQSPPLKYNVFIARDVRLSPNVNFNTIDRREGMTFTLVYVGDGVYDVYGG